jgi:hypothetical protein
MQSLTPTQVPSIRENASAATRRFGSVAGGLIAVMLSTSLALADQSIVPLQILPAAAAAASYSMVADIQTPHGKEHTTEQIRLVARDTSGFDATLAGADAQSQTFQLNQQRGFLVLRDPRLSTVVVRSVSMLNLLTAPLFGAPTPILQGATWIVTASVTVPGSDASSIPLSVTARTVVGQDVTLSARGHGTSSVRRPGMRTRVDIALKLDESFRDGRLVSAIEERTMSARVFFKTAATNEKWTVSAI